MTGTGSPDESIPSVVVDSPGYSGGGIKRPPSQALQSSILNALFSTAVVVVPVLERICWVDRLLLLRLLDLRLCRSAYLCLLYLLSRTKQQHRISKNTDPVKMAADRNPAFVSITFVVFLQLPFSHCSPCEQSLQLIHDVRAVVGCVAEWGDEHEFLVHLP